MNIKELMQELQKYPSDTELIASIPNNKKHLKFEFRVMNSIEQGYFDVENNSFHSPESLQEDFPDSDSLKYCLLLNNN